jgi:hypothetical protein
MIFLGVCLVGTVLGEHYYANLKFRNEIEPEALMAELSKHLEPKYCGYLFPVSVGKQVLDILIRAKSKSKPNIILDKYSANDLIELDKVSIDDCLRVRIKERSNSCQKFSSHENLFKYCTKTVINLRDWCSLTKQSDVIFVMELNKLGQKNTAHKFLADVSFHIKDAQKKLKKEIKKLKKLGKIDENAKFEVKSIDYKKVLASTLMTNGESYEAEIKSICKQLTATIDIDYQLTDKEEVNYKDDRLTTFVKYCRIINDFSPDDTDRSLLESNESSDKQSPAQEKAKKIFSDLAGTLYVWASSIAPSHQHTTSPKEA